MASPQAAEAEIDRILQEADALQAPARDALRGFHDSMAASGVSPSTILRNALWSWKFLGWVGGKDPAQITRKDIETVLRDLERGRIGKSRHANGNHGLRGGNGEPYADWSKVAIKNSIKAFFKWQRGHEGEGYPDVVSWIEVGVRKRNMKLPEDLLTEEEVKTLIGACYNARDRAMVFLLYESAARASEVLSMRVKDVQFDRSGATAIFPRGKTGPMRRRIVASTPHLVLWLKEHPARDGKGNLDPNAPLFCAVRKGAGTKRIQPEEVRPLGYSGLRMLTRELAKRAGLKKRVHPHGFRHARATYLAKRLPDPVFGQYVWGNPYSRMKDRYTHLAGKDVDEAIDRLHGIKQPEKPEESPLKPRECPRCKFLNPPGIHFCGECTAPLDIKTMMALEEAAKPGEVLMAGLLEGQDLDRRIGEVVEARLAAALKEKGLG